MSKKNKNKAKQANVKAEEKEVLAEATLSENASEPTVVAENVTEKNKKGKVVEVKAKDVNKKSKKEKTKKPNKMAKALKDTGSELKKITWPKFGQVVKQTGIVLAVVIIFALVLLGLDQLCMLLVGLL